MNTDFIPFFHNKRIALVGPSNCIIDAQQGAEIDAHDVVIRLNHQWPIDSYHEVDLGKRMDVLYHCCNPDFSVMRLAIPALQETHMVFYEDGIQTSLLRMICAQKNILFFDITWQYQKLEKALSTRPNTGLVAITHILSLPIASLKLFGITFFQEPYYKGYRGIGANTEYWNKNSLPQQIWEHRLDVQYQYFLRYLAVHPKLIIDPYARQIMSMSIDKAPPPLLL
jgi:hypothetical protein